MATNVFLVLDDGSVSCELEVHGKAKPSKCTFIKSIGVLGSTLKWFCEGDANCQPNKNSSSE